MVGTGGTGGLSGARILRGARVDAMLVDTGLALGTVGVGRTLGSRGN